MRTTFNTVEEYINSFPKDVQHILQKVRKTIKENAPEAEERISYGMPGYKTHGKPLVYFAGYKYHIGFYATPNAHKLFKTELSKYKQGKGSVQFPISDPIPFNLIKQMVQFRLEENRIKTLK